ncbi:MAG: hypothetical protein KZQ66_12865 [Candidatus Thiodiazotropha sp. (ex Lucinoma aequizonata)]|nr:hypothetical protein [Candidatus Thiodiazotropha sp. (ex Lucinoma aequizonata)]MCU7887983.1 hypothetical protein [Candidatus Thiodiazotropha sp. (ex Lucinoma aequizonata)]MCU7894601.1 hypothetical protein [Candidatus Thiodiazotropha sp. (ex Lucinoma aequizonata)]MCU7899993.1 hypothetical protein [Candidatus Thiodiazotropha sp. (ex Lucinoma aequizonata)]MCU7902774.1 hypothetical protein [Candidatus Thiodiazotropha sp. (ex Lucinoma aequizonata)]
MINADNGPENSGRRTQWLKRLTELSDTHQLTIQLTYYPPITASAIWWNVYGVYWRTTGRGRS